MRQSLLRYKHILCVDNLHESWQEVNICSRLFGLMNNLYSIPFVFIAHVFLIGIKFYNHFEFDRLRQSVKKILKVLLLD